MVELALAFRDQDGSYAEHAAVVLTSVFHNSDAQITVHILHDETLTDVNRLRITQLVMAYNHTVHFYPVFLPIDLAELVDGAQSVTTWTRGSMYRLLLPSLLNVNKVIYLDCDVLVNLNIQELWNIDLNAYYLAAVKDLGAVALIDILSSFGLNPLTYFNSGVIVFELNNIRQNTNWYVDMLGFLRQYPGTTLPDQDVLNHIFGNNYLELDGQFNAFSINNPELDINHKIVHFAGETKWWHPASPGFTLYQEYLNLTPWRLPESHFAGLAQSVVPQHETRPDHGDPAVQEGTMLPVPPLEHEEKHPAQPVHPTKKARPKRPRRLLRLKKLKKLKKLKLLRRIHRGTPIQRKYRYVVKRRRMRNSYPGKMMHTRKSRQVIVKRRRKVNRTALQTVHYRTKKSLKKSNVHKTERMSPPFFTSQKGRMKEGRPFFMTM
ncbi:MAG TPA: glycosyltransferase family 8 protein [Paenibacillus sp.]